MRISRMVDLYFLPYTYFRERHIKKFFEKDILMNMDRKNVLTREQIQKVKDFYASYYKNVETFYHSFYTEKTGVFSEKYIPSNIFYNNIDAYFNKVKEAKILDNKCYYPILFSGIPQADTIAYKNGAFWYNAQREIIKKEQLKDIINGQKDIFVKKAMETSGGKGVQYIKAEEGELYDEFEKVIKTMPADIVVQTPLKQHEKLAAINESSVNTIRVLSVLGEEGAKIYSYILRMGVGRSKVDNASSGGVTCGIGFDGRLKKRAYKPTGESFEKHPTSGFVFDGYRIPGFEKIEELVKKAHPMIPRFRMVSWDFAINEEGNPVLIEANLSFGQLDFHQLNNGPLFGDDTTKILDEVFGKK